MSKFHVTPDGVITVDTMDVLAEYQDAYKSALGADLNLDASTPQGQLITNDTNNHSVLQAEIVELVNNFSVYYASGRSLDVAGSRYGYYRKDGAATAVVVTIIGTPDTTVPAGFMVSDGNNNYETLDATVISSDGSVNALCQCTVSGQIFCPKNTVTEIVTPITGIDAVNNPQEGIVGYDTESDNVFRQRILANILQKRSRTTLGALVDNIAELDNVLSVIGRENPENTTQIIDSVEMPPHSIYLAVLGGNSDSIAEVFAKQKTLGATTVGNTPVSFLDKNINYAYTYNIERPAVVSVYIKIQYKDNPTSPVDSVVVEQIKTTLKEYLLVNRFSIGETVSSPNISQAFINFNTADVVSISVSLDGENYSQYVSTNIQEIPVLEEENIVVEKVS